MGAPAVRVLGELAVDGLELRAIGDRKARQLLWLLALARGRSLSADALAESLWGDAPPARPAEQVAVLASRLRRTLGREAVEHGDQGYRLAYGWLDLDELAVVTAEAERRRAAGNISGAAATSRIALALIRGPVAAPVHESAWVEADRAAAVRLVARARRIAAASMLDAGDWSHALDLATEDLQAEPYDEQAVRLAMRAHAIAGRPGAALAVFAALQRRLADELGADPAEETLILHGAILRGDPMQHVAPAPADSLIGRADQLGHLDALVDRARSGTMRIAVVVGEAGIGKTTLVTGWARRRAQQGDTVLLGSCGQLDSSTPLDVLLSALGEHVRRSPAPDDVLGEQGVLLRPLLGMASDEPAPAIGPDPVLGPATLFAAITTVLGRIAGRHGLIVVIDDAHLAGSALADWARFALRRSAAPTTSSSGSTLPILLVAAVRPAEGTPFPATDEVSLGPLDRDETAQLVGEARADELHARSGGHPLFLSELAQSPDQVTPSLVAAVEQRCAQLGSAADVLVAAAALGPDLDIDLLASVLGRAGLDVLADLELAEARNLVVERAGRYTFRHELVRDALAASVRGGRAALLHREAGRVLARRPHADPVAVAEHARLGGDLAQAAASLRLAAARAAERFDHATAAALLDQSLALHPDETTLLERARIRTRLGRYAEAEADVAAVSVASAEACEIGAWATYFDRRFDRAISYAGDGELAAGDEDTRVRCLMVGGRTLHARGDLAAAERRLTAAAASASGADRLTAAAWLGVLRSHRSQTSEALELLGPLTRLGAGADLTSATLHAHLFTGHALALAGRPAQALAAFEAYTAEVDRRHVPRFSGRGVNMSGWVLRNVGESSRAVDAHHQALQVEGIEGRVEMHIAALEDLAEEQLRVHDPDGAGRLLAEAEGLLGGDLVFGWRLELKLALLRARQAMMTGEAGQALGLAGQLVGRSDALGVPRYASVGRVLEHQARAVLGEPVAPHRVAADLATVEDSVRLEAWWWTGETGALLGSPELVDRAEVLAADLARESGRFGDALRAEADRCLTRWRRGR